MKRLLLVALAVLATACSGSEGDRPAEQSTPKASASTTTTTRIDPRDAFFADIRARLSYNNPEVPSVALSMAESMCHALGLADGSTPTANLGLTQVMAADLDDAVTAVVMLAGAEHLCPDQLNVVRNFLANRGLAA